MEICRLLLKMLQKKNVEAFSLTSKHQNKLDVHESGNTIRYLFYRVSAHIDSHTTVFECVAHIWMLLIRIYCGVCWWYPVAAEKSPRLQI